MTAAALRALAAAALVLALVAVPVVRAAPPEGGDRPAGGGRDGKGGKGEKDGKDGKGGRDGKADGDAGKRDGAPRTLGVGDAVRDLALDLADGGTWSPTAGRPAVLVFAGAWSAESVEALTRLGDPKGRLAATRADLVGILRDADAAKARETAKEAKLSVRLAVDPRRKAYDRFASRGLPYTVVIDGSGKILLSESGFDEAAAAAKLEPPSPRK